VLTPSANNERDFCTSFVIFLLLNYEFSNKSLEFAVLYRKKENRKKERRKEKKKYFTKRRYKETVPNISPKPSKGIQIVAQ